jgi:hypothetical protein
MLSARQRVDPQAIEPPVLGRQFFVRVVHVATGRLQRLMCHEALQRESSVRDVVATEGVNVLQSGTA